MTKELNFFAWGKAIQININNINDTVNIINHDNSNGYWCSTGNKLYQETYNFIKNNLIYLKNFEFNILDSKKSLSFYKDDEYLIYPRLYKPLKKIDDATIIEISNNQKQPWLHHANYIEDNLKNNKLFLDMFSFSQEQEEITNKLVRKYNIDFTNTLAVCYRGTDKFHECCTAPVDKWIEKAIEIKEKYNLSKIFIQTDQEQVKQLFINTFKNDCIYLEEMPTSEGNRGLHHIIKSNKFEFIQNIHAAIKILASCKFLINSTGNFNCAIAMYRGTSKNTWQFNCKQGIFYEDF